MSCFSSWTSRDRACQRCCRPDLSMATQVPPCSRPQSQSPAPPPYAAPWPSTGAALRAAAAPAASALGAGAVVPGVDGTPGAAIRLLAVVVGAVGVMVLA